MTNDPDQRPPLSNITSKGATRRSAWSECDRKLGDPPPPTGSNYDVMCILPDGRRGYFDGRCLWTSTGTTIHNIRDAEEYAGRARLRACLDPGESMSAVIVAAVRAEVEQRERGPLTTAAPSTEDP